MLDDLMSYKPCRAVEYEQWPVQQTMCLQKEKYVCVLNNIKQTTLELYYDDDNNDDDFDDKSDKRTGTINCY